MLLGSTLVLDVGAVDHPMMTTVRTEVRVTDITLLPLGNYAAQSVNYGTFRCPTSDASMFRCSVCVEFRQIYEQ